MDYVVALSSHKERLIAIFIMKAGWFVVIFIASFWLLPTAVFLFWMFATIAVVVVNSLMAMASLTGGILGGEYVRPDSNK